MLGMWEGMVAVVIPTGLTQGADVTTGWYNELWDIEVGTEQSVKSIESQCLKSISDK